MFASKESCEIQHLTLWAFMLRSFIPLFSETLHGTRILTPPQNSACKTYRQQLNFFRKQTKSQNLLCSVTAEKYENRFEKLNISQKRYVIGKFHGDFRDQQKKCIRNT